MTNAANCIIFEINFTIFYLDKMDKFRNPISKLDDIENFQPAETKTNKMDIFNQDDDVFGFEEETYSKKYLDTDSENDNEEDDELSEKQILQKRSSNQNLNDPIHIKNTNYTNIHKINKNNNNYNNSKYSCSLPRDIISNRLIRASENDQPDISQENEDSRFDSDDEYEKCGDMRLAISNLASSIVAKDGRELFGGVPSRRIPINSISQSYF